MSKCPKPMPKWNHKPQVSGSTEKTSLQHYAISIVYKSIKKKALHYCKNCSGISERVNRTIQGTLTLPSFFLLFGAWYSNANLYRLLTRWLLLMWRRCFIFVTSNSKSMVCNICLWQKAKEDQESINMSTQIDSGKALPLKRIQCM